MTAPKLGEAQIGPALGRAFAMPTPNTFTIGPVAEFVSRHLSGVSVDPFARNARAATYTNDIDPETDASYHMDAVDFLSLLRAQGVVADSALFDPPYSPRQISECYRAAGRHVSARDTQNAALYKRVRDSLNDLIRPGGIVLSFGWNSAGMGRTRGYRIIEILLVAHGGAHNDTICLAEIKEPAGRQALKETRG